MRFLCQGETTGRRAGGGGWSRFNYGVQGPEAGGVLPFPPPHLGAGDGGRKRGDRVPAAAGPRLPREPRSGIRKPMVLAGRSQTRSLQRFQGAPRPPGPPPPRPPAQATPLPSPRREAGRRGRGGGFSSRVFLSHWEPGGGGTFRGTDAEPRARRPPENDVGTSGRTDSGRPERPRVPP
jgi:hypothetical protein